jgi:homoserine O-acetyltransferase
LKVQNNNIDKFQIEEFSLESGEILEDVEIAYTTYGKLSEKGDNAILVFHALTGSHLLAGKFKRFHDKSLPWNEELEVGWWDEFVGPDKIIDTNVHYVICANYLGGCYGSTGPNSYNQDKNEIFPEITFIDIENSQKQLLDYLGVKTLSAVIGPSIGGLMALEFASRFPDFVEKIISISSSYKVSTLQLLHNLEQAYILNLGKESKAREKEHLALARMIAHKTYISLELLSDRAKNESKYSRDRLDNFIKTSQESYMMHQGEKFIERFTSESYLSIIRGWQNFKMPEEALEKYFIQKSFSFERQF